MPGFALGQSNYQGGQSGQVALSLEGLANSCEMALFIVEGASNNGVFDFAIFRTQLLVQEREIGLILDLFNDLITWNVENGFLANEVSWLRTILGGLFNVIDLLFEGRDMFG